ncbi:MAG: amino acid permease [Psittacicella sp.]
MIFLTIFSLEYGQQLYYQMGYSSLTYLLIAVVLFFIPYNLILTDFVSYFRKDTGGIFSWMNYSYGFIFSSIGISIWYLSKVIYLVGSSSVSIQLSNIIYGKDISWKWHLLSLNNTETLAIIGIIYLFILTIVSRRSLKLIVKLNLIAFFSFVIINLFILLSSFTLLCLNNFHFQQPFILSHLSIYNLFHGPNKFYNSPIKVLGFLIFPIAMFGGFEAILGLIDYSKSPKQAPKVVFLCTCLIIILYIIIILLSGASSNWKEVLDVKGVNLYNLGVYIVKHQLELLMIDFGFSKIQALHIALNINRVIAIIGIVSFFNMPLMIYYPIRQSFEKISSLHIKNKLLKKNKYGIFENILYLQNSIIGILILLIGIFGNSAADIYYHILISSLISLLIPWLCISLSYIKFKIKQPNSSSYINKKMGILIGIIVSLTLIVTISINLITPFLDGELAYGLWQIIPIIVFILIGIIVGKSLKIKKAYEKTYS